VALVARNYVDINWSEVRARKYIFTEYSSPSPSLYKLEVTTVLENNHWKSRKTFLTVTINYITANINIRTVKKFKAKISQTRFQSVGLLMYSSRFPHLISCDEGRTLVVINNMEQVLRQKLIVRSASQKILCLLRNPKVHYHVHKARHRFLSWVRLIQSTPSKNISSR
jgi:hypothetical protein